MPTTIRFTSRASASVVPRFLLGFAASFLLVGFASAQNIFLCATTATELQGSLDAASDGGIYAGKDVEGNRSELSYNDYGVIAARRHFHRSAMFQKTRSSSMLPAATSTSLKRLR